MLGFLGFALASLSGVSLAEVTTPNSNVTVTQTAAPTVSLDKGVFTGTRLGKVERFLGIPFAKPPVGDLRLRLPVAIPAYNGTYTATSFGLSCPQQAIELPILTGLSGDAADYVLNSIFGQVFPDSEDCLTINVIRPVGITAATKLPVVAWIFGGGFLIGSPVMYDGANIVARSIELGTPIIYVSMNYRVSAFGFLASKEVKTAGVGNLGIHDQREALRWIQEYIGAFDGDPTKVTIWGESAGAISVACHMVANDGNTGGLFRGGFMQSGSAIPTGDITHGQKHYDFLVSRTGCAGQADTLACLRALPYSTLKAAVDKSAGIFSYQSLNLPWLPRADGVLFSDGPQRLVQQGKVARIPFVTGDVDDEGTLFSLSTLNVTTDQEFDTYFKQEFLPMISSVDLISLSSLYTSNVLSGSPFDTGLFNILTPQFKRIAAMLGDAVFQAPRRYLLETTAGKQKSWSFLSKRLKELPFLGSVHASDILNVYFGGDMADYLINFVVTLDPNGKTGIDWPEYTIAGREQLTFLDGLIPLTITTDNYRTDGMKELTKVTLANPI